MSFSINPCKACNKRFSSCDINALNNCVYDTAAAFLNATSIDEVDKSSLAQNAKDCIDLSKSALGRSQCAFRLSEPPIFQQVPNYFPDLFYKTRNKERALKMCEDMCSNTPYPNECKERCQTQADAVVLKEGYKNDYKHQSKKDPFAFYLGFTLFAIFFIFIIVLFIKIIFIK